MTTAIQTSGLKTPVEVAEYLFRRLQQVGVESVHGVPGDYNLVALDYIDKVGLKWVGSCNELNAGYAADGYARVKGISALVTTFGVGELSAVNAIAGAYSERVGIVHIVGTPSTISQKDGMLLHHTLGNGNFNVFADMNKEINCVIAKLSNPDDIAIQIDNAIRECWLQSRPVYVLLPTDMVLKKIEEDRLKIPIDLQYPGNEAEKEDYVVDVVLKYLQNAKNPVILVDACAIRHRVLDETHALIDKSGLPTFVTPMGKGAVNETLPQYGGVYAGSGSNAGVRERVESSDLILSIGAIKSDFNTAEYRPSFASLMVELPRELSASIGDAWLLTNILPIGFTYRVSQLSTIDFHSDKIQVRYSQYPGVRMRGVLRKMVGLLGDLNVQAGPKASNTIAAEDSEGPVVTHNWLWPRIGQWLQPNDVVITETGTANFGIWETRFPKGVTAISQVLWGSIGYSVGACQGAALAAKETGDRRTVLFVGDGSFQLTVQELSTMIRHDLKPIMKVEWKWKDLVAAFGAKEGKARTYQVKTKGEMEELLNSKDFCAASCLQFVELYMPKKDAPRALQLTAEASAENNAKG